MVNIHNALCVYFCSKNEGQECWKMCMLLLWCWCIAKAWLPQLMLWCPTAHLATKQLIRPPDDVAALLKCRCAHRLSKYPFRGDLLKTALHEPIRRAVTSYWHLHCLCSRLTLRTDDGWHLGSSGRPCSAGADLTGCRVGLCSPALNHQ